jgi:hypothetical protein
MHPYVPPVVDLTKHLEVEELLDRRPDLLAVIAKCIICQRRSDMTGVFVVNAKHAIAYGVEDFKTRSFVYGLCSPCSESPDRPVLLQQIEARFFADAQMPSATVQ